MGRGDCWRQARRYGNPWLQLVWGSHLKKKVEWDKPTCSSRSAAAAETAAAAAAACALALAKNDITVTAL